MTRLRLGTRGSALALWQANRVASELRQRGGLDCELVVITTTGDRLTDANLSTIGGKRVFVKEIEHALLHGEIDLAVHSAKDMPADLPDGLAIAAVLPREDPRDAVVVPASVSTAAGRPATELVAAQGPEPRVGSGSVRRVAQLSRVWPTARFRLVRGNVGTRLRKLDAGGYDLLILAAAGLKRLGFAHRISAPVDEDLCVPSPGQGIIAIETRDDDPSTRAALAPINDPTTNAGLVAERAVVTALGGGCQVPIGALAEHRGHRLYLRAIVASLDGSQLLRRESTMPANAAQALGVAVAEGLLADGAGPILEAARSGPTEEQSVAEATAGRQEESL